MENTKKSSEILNNSDIGAISDQEIMLSNLVEYQQFVINRGRNMLVVNGFADNSYIRSIFYNLDSIELTFGENSSYDIPDEYNILLTKNHLALNDNDWQDYLDTSLKERLEKEKVEQNAKLELEFHDKLNLYWKLKEELGFVTRDKI